MTVSYTLGQLTDQTFRNLRGTTRDEINLLSAPLDVTTAGTVETINFSQAVNGIVSTALIVIGTETMYVISSNPNNSTAVVIRGYDDTTPVASPSGSPVLVNPAWTRDIVQSHLKDEIRSWAPQVFQVNSVEIPIVSLQRGYDLGAITTPIVRILEVTAPQPPYVGAPGYWDVSSGSNAIDTEQANPSFPFTYSANANPVEFPSGKALFLTGTGLPTVAGNLHVVYAAPYDVDTQWDENTDMVANVGLDSRDFDIPALGAASRLLRMISVRRAMLNVQGQSRADQDVTMPAILQAAQQFQLARDSRLGDAVERIYSDWPIRSSNY